MEENKNFLQGNLCKKDIEKSVNYSFEGIIAGQGIFFQTEKIS